MRDSKLYQWLSKLPTQEQNEFGRYVSLQGGRNRDELAELISLFLGKVVRRGDMRREDFFNEWKKGSEPFNPNQLNKRLSELKDLLDEFLGFQELRQNPVTKAVLLAQALKHRGLVEFGKSEQQDALKTLAAAPIDSDQSLHSLQIAESYLQLTLDAPRSTKKFEEPVFQPLLHHVEQYFFAQILRYACAAMNQDRIFGTDHHMEILAFVLPRIEQVLAQCHPLVRIYYRIYRMQLEPEDRSHFDALRAEIAANGHQFEAELHRDIYTYAINHCVRRINMGEAGFYETLANIYSETRHTGVLLSNGRIETSALKNIISIAVRSGKLHLAAELLQEYGAKLSPPAPWAITYNQAVIDYHRVVEACALAQSPRDLLKIKALEQELVQVRSVFYNLIGQSDDLFYDMDAKAYYLRISYELGQFDMFEIQFEPLRVFLGRKKGISQAHKENYRQFIYHLKDLCRIRTDDTLRKQRRQEKLQALLHKLESSNDVANIDWLRQKTKAALAE